MSKTQLSSTKGSEACVDAIHMLPKELIKAIKRGTTGLDTQGNPSEETYRYLADKFDLPYDTVKYLYSLQ